MSLEMRVVMWELAAPALSEKHFPFSESGSLQPLLQVHFVLKPNTTGASRRRPGQISTWAQSVTIAIDGLSKLVADHEKVEQFDLAWEEGHGPAGARWRLKSEL